MDDKQIFAALEITGHEVRLIVGEFFNTRFNIIKVEQVPCTGLSLNAVEQPEEVVDAIQKVMQEKKEESVLIFIENSDGMEFAAWIPKMDRPA